MQDVRVTPETSGRFKIPIFSRLPFMKHNYSSDLVLSKRVQVRDTGTTLKFILIFQHLKPPKEDT